MTILNLGRLSKNSSTRSRARTNFQRPFLLVTTQCSCKAKRKIRRLPKLADGSSRMLPCAGITSISHRSLKRRKTRSAGRNWSKLFVTVRSPPGSILICTGSLISRMSEWSIRWAWQFPKIRTGNRTKIGKFKTGSKPRQMWYGKNSYETNLSFV